MCRGPGADSSEHASHSSPFSHSGTFRSHSSIFDSHSAVLIGTITCNTPCQQTPQLIENGRDKRRGIPTSTSPAWTEHCRSTSAYCSEHTLNRGRSSALTIGSIGLYASLVSTVNRLFRRLGARSAISDDGSTNGSCFAKLDSTSCGRSAMPGYILSALTLHIDPTTANLPSGQRPTFCGCNLMP